MRGRSFPRWIALRPVARPPGGVEARVVTRRARPPGRETPLEPARAVSRLGQAATRPREVVVSRAAPAHRAVWVVRPPEGQAARAGAGPAGCPVSRAPWDRSPTTRCPPAW